MNQETLITIPYSQVPEYLRSSELYLSFSDEPEDEIYVPSNCYKDNDTVENASDLEQMLLTMRFWILRRFPEEVIKFFVHSFNEDCEIVLLAYKEEFPSVLDLVKDLHVSSYKLANCHLACKHGRIDFLEYFVKRGGSVQMFDLQITANNGHFDCLSFGYNHLPSKHKVQFLYKMELIVPVQKGHFDCLTFLVNCGVEADESFCARAVRHNQLNCLTFLVAHMQKKGREISDLTWITAIKNSNPCFEFLLRTYPAVLGKSDLLMLACGLGNSDALHTLLKHNSVVDNAAITMAAEGGSFECLRILHNDLGLNCWVPSTMAAAAGAGKIKLVKRLHEMGCPWDGTAIAAAMRTNQQHCHHYLAQRFAQSTIY